VFEKLKTWMAFLYITYTNMATVEDLFRKISTLSPFNLIHVYNATTESSVLTDSVYHLEVVFQEIRKRCKSSADHKDIVKDILVPILLLSPEDRNAVHVVAGRCLTARRFQAAFLEACDIQHECLYNGMFAFFWKDFHLCYTEPGEDTSMYFSFASRNYAEAAMDLRHGGNGVLSFRDVFNNFLSVAMAYQETRIVQAVMHLVFKHNASNIIYIMRFGSYMTDRDKFVKSFLATNDTPHHLQTANDALHSHLGEYYTILCALRQKRLEKEGRQERQERQEAEREDTALVSSV